MQSMSTDHELANAMGILAGCDPEPGETICSFPSGYANENIESTWPAVHHIRACMIS